MIRFEPRYAIQHIVVAGLGGTGSQLARSIARILYDMRRSHLSVPSVLFVDPDRVEEQNCGRQMFVPGADVGYFKAELLARRFNAALGLDIAWDAAPFDPEKHGGRYGTLLVGCVDNHLARRALAQVNTLWLDCGNHAGESGQVICGSTSDPVLVRDALAKNDSVISVLPNAALIFPDLLEPEQEAPAENLSCATLVAEGQQHVLVNDAVATAAAPYIYRLLRRIPLHSWMTFVSLDAVRPVAITSEDIESYIVT